MEAIIKFSGKPPEKTEVLGCGFGIINADEETLQKLYDDNEIEDIELPKRLYTGEYNVSSSVCITGVRSNESYGLSGKGTVIGIADTGIDYTHPAFIDNNGNTRIVSIWDMTYPGNAPEGFFKGSEYTENEINNALKSESPFEIVPQRDYSGHGTAVSGIAAGGEFCQDTGIAPEARLIVVKLGAGDDEFAVSTDIMRALRYIIDKARTLRLPLSVNISYGMNEGSHRGDSLFEQYIDSVASEWKTVISVPTGNEGGSGHHYHGKIRSGEALTVDFFTSSDISSLYLSLWKNFADEMSIKLITPDGTLSPALSEKSSLISYQAPGTIITGIVSGPTRYSASQEIYWLLKAADELIPEGQYRLIVNAGRITDGSFDIWLPTVEQVGRGTYFSYPENKLTMTIPATANKVIRTAGINSRINAPAEFSGVGKNIVFPDIAAPAVGVAAPLAYSGCASFTGTSFASPFSCGAAALIMEWGIVKGNSPFLYGEKIKALFRKGAEGATDFFPDLSLGYGTLCIKKSLEAAEALH